MSPKKNKPTQSTMNKVEDQKKDERKGEEAFDLVIVNIKAVTDTGIIECEKKNVYDPELRYIVISYPWGELSEQQEETIDYTAHVISFDLEDLKSLCYNIGNDPDLKEIDYLWVDAISVDQHNHARKKETILKMNQIY
ncbi:unnamed protein product [Cunninghamella blakesleeana]